MQIHKKRLALIALLPLLLIGVVYAFKYEWVPSAIQPTSEPFELLIHDDLALTWPGQSDTVKLRIKNSATVTYGVKITVSVKGPASWEYVKVSGALYEVGYELNIDPGDGYYWIEVTADPAAPAPSEIQVFFQVERVGPFK